LLPKSTVYDYFAQWRDDGTWTKLVKALREQTRVKAGREPTPSGSLRRRGSIRGLIPCDQRVSRVENCITQLFGQGL
jgi:transposase